MPNPEVLSRQALAGLVGAAAIGLAGMLHSFGQTSLLIWWGAGALAGVLMRFGTGLWFAMWCGAALALLALGASPATTLLTASGLVVGPALLAAYLERSEFRAGFPRREDVLRFAVASAVAMSVPPALAWLGLRALPIMPKPLGHASHALEWWAHGTIASLLIAPAVAGLSRATLEGWRREPWPLVGALQALAMLLVANAALPVELLRVTTMPFAVLLAVYVAQRTDLVFGSLFCLAVVMSIILRSEPGGVGFVYSLVVAATTLLVRSMFAERRRMQQQLQADAARHRGALLEAAVQERRRIGRDVHDTIGQELTAIALLARLVEDRERTSSPQLAAQAAAVQEACTRATRAARRISHQLLSPGSEDAGAEAGS